MLQKTGILFICLTLLLSMTEISKVAMLGYTLFSDGDKAALLCTCIGCSHKAKSETEPAMCTVGTSGANHDEDQPSHCSVQSQDGDSLSICACGAQQSGDHHILLNSLDKIALLFPQSVSGPGYKCIDYVRHGHGTPLSFSPDIFHPPRG